MQHDTTVMAWQPPMLRLHAVPHPDIDGGAPTLVYISPQCIVAIDRQSFNYNSADDPTKKYPQQLGTRVIITPSHTHFVTESVEVVAMMRDRALGHEPKIGPV